MMISMMGMTEKKEHDFNKIYVIVDFTLINYGVEDDFVEFKEYVNGQTNE